jgi:hypothetical protein
MRESDEQTGANVEKLREFLRLLLLMGHFPVRIS